MQFFTKSWYHAMQSPFYGPALQSDPQAEHFSEAYYRKLYREEKARYYAEMDTFSIPVKPHSFYTEFRSQTKRLLSDLPQYILDEVADIRVLALHHCSQTVKEMITFYNAKCQNQVDGAIKAYAEHERVQFAKKRPSFLDDFVLHDCLATSFRKKGNDYHLLFSSDMNSNMHGIKRVIFKKATVLQKEKPLSGAWWLYEEVHKTEDGYEIGVLFDKKDVFEFSIKCNDIILEFME